MSKGNDLLQENPKKRKITATDDYAPIDDDEINNDQYAAPPEDDAQVYYDDNTYGGEGEPSSLPSNVPYGEPTGVPTKKPRTGEPTSASSINTVMPTNQQTANNTESDDDIPIYEKQPSLAPIQGPMPTIIENDDDELESRTPVPTYVPTYLPVQPPQQQISNRQVGWTTGEIAGTAAGGFIGLLMLIPVVRFFVKKFTNPSVGVAHPVRSNAYSSSEEVEGDDDVESADIEDTRAKKTSKVSPLNIGDDDFEQDEVVQKTIKVKKIPDETIPKLDTKINSRKVIPQRQMEVITEEKPIDKSGDQNEELDLNLDEIFGEQEQQSQIVEEESDLTSLFQSQPKSSRIILDPIEKRKEPSSTSVSNLVTIPVINKSLVLGGGKEDL